MSTLQDTKNSQVKIKKNLRLQDKHRHFLGEIKGESIFIYCKRCKEFVELKIKNLQKDQ